MAVCDICSSPGMGTVISSDQMRKAVRNGFNPFKLGLIPALLGPEDMFTHWKNTVVLQDTSDWNICSRCMLQLNNYLKEAPKPKNINKSYSYPEFNDPERAEVVRQLNEMGITDMIESKQNIHENPAPPSYQPLVPEPRTAQSYAPKQTPIETSEKTKRTWIATDKRGILGIIIGSIIGIIPLLGIFIGGFVGGFISKKTLNGLIPAILSGISWMFLYNDGTIESSGVPIWFMLGVFVVFSVIMGILPSYVGAYLGKSYFKKKTESSDLKKNIKPDLPLKTCPKCNTKNPIDAVFCMECGSEWSETPKSSVSKEVKTESDPDREPANPMKLALDLPKGTAIITRFKEASEGIITSFIIHEDRGLVKALPPEVPVQVRSVLFTRENVGVIPVLLQINEKIYETWWNFHNPLHRKCIEDINRQDKLLITFLADSTEPERIIWVPNSLRSGFNNAINVLQDMNPWKMEEFDVARDELYKEYPDPRVLWNSFNKEGNSQENNASNDSNEDSNNLLDKLSVLENAYLVRNNPELEKLVDESLDSITAEGDPGINLLLNRLFKDMKLNNNKLIVSFTGDLAWNEWLKKRTIVEALVRANAKSTLPDLKSLSTVECQYGQFYEILEPAIVKALNEIGGDEKKIDEEFNENNKNSEDFYMVVSNKYTAFGSLFTEGKIKQGILNIGDTVDIYDKDGNCKYKNKSVVRLTSKQSDVEKIKQGDEEVAIVFEGLQNFGDVEYKDIISKKELDITPKTKKSEPVKELPTPKTYNDPDRSTHINIATNDLSSIFSNAALGGNLTPEQEQWIKNVGEDLYNAHGFEAMQEVFINVKNRYPSITSLFSKLWDGIGGWAD